MENYTYCSTKERFKAEYKIYIAAFIMIIIADSIGQIKLPIGPGQLLLFPIFYALLLGIIQGPHVLKIFNEKEVKISCWAFCHCEMDSRPCRFSLPVFHSKKQPAG